MIFLNRLLTLILLMAAFHSAFAGDVIERIYHKQCATCHGDNGDGVGRAGASLFPAPTNFRSPTLHSRSDAELANAIRDGKPGSSMSAYATRLSDAQIDQLVAYIRRSFMNSSRLEEVTAPAAKVTVPVVNDHKDLGRKIYEANCSACHGDRGNTATWARNGLVPAPRDFTTELSRKLLGRERMIHSVTNGRPGTAMMSFAKRLQANEIEAVVDFIRSEFMQVGAFSLHEQAKLNSQENRAMPQGLQGDANKGRAFFMANCADCHGRLGNGQGPRAYFNRPAPRDFTTAQSRAELDRPRLFNSVKNGKRGSVMPAWGKVLNDQQIADVVEFVYQQFIVQKQVVVEKKP